jgi:hypothetical protein
MNREELIKKVDEHFDTAIEEGVLWHDDIKDWEALKKELTKLERIEEVVDKGGTITTNYNVIQKIKSILEE